MRNDLTDYALRITSMADSLNVGFELLLQTNERYFRNNKLPNPGSDGILAPMIRLLILATLMGLLAACTAASPTPPLSPAVGPTLPLATFTPTPAELHASAATKPTSPPALNPHPDPTPTPLPAFWTLIFPGADALKTSDNLAILRHAPGLVRYGVHFEGNPDAARTVSQWLDGDADTRAAVNCGFYWEKEGAYLHMGLLEVDGERLAQVRPRWGAALVVRNNRARIVRQPKKRIPPMTLGVQGWPTLLWRGEIVPEMAEMDDGTLARRTAVGVDGEGRVLWVVDGYGSTLTDFAQRLQEADIGLVDAVNLDGGASTGLRWLSEAGGEQDGVDSLPIPCVITFAPLP